MAPAPWRGGRAAAQCNTTLLHTAAAHDAQDEEQRDSAAPSQRTAVPHALFEGLMFVDALVASLCMAKQKMMAKSSTRLVALAAVLVVAGFVPVCVCLNMGGV